MVDNGLRNRSWVVESVDFVYDESAGVEMDQPLNTGILTSV